MLETDPQNRSLLQLSEELIRAQVVVEYFRKFDQAAAMGVGHTDLSFGIDYLRRTLLPYVSLNVVDEDGKQAFASYRMIEGTRIWGLTRETTNVNSRFRSTRSIVDEIKREQKSPACYDVLLTDVTRENLDHFREYFDVVFWSRVVDDEIKTYQSGNISSVRLQGRDIGVATLLSPTDIHTDFVPLPSSISDDEAVASLVDGAVVGTRKLHQDGVGAFATTRVVDGDRYSDSAEYREILVEYLRGLSSNESRRIADSLRAVDPNAPNEFDSWTKVERALATGELYRILAKLESAPSTASSFGYASSEACARCHQEAYTAWTRTAHSRAYSAIEVKGEPKPECIGCHVTGYGQKNGPQRSADYVQVRSLVNVGCEQCHGASKSHARDPQNNPRPANVSVDVCTACHVPEHSLKFDKEWIHAVRCDRNKNAIRNPRQFVLANCSDCHNVPGKWKESNDRLLHALDKRLLSNFSFENFLKLSETGRGNMPAYPELADDPPFARSVYDYVVKELEGDSE